MANCGQMYGLQMKGEYWATYKLLLQTQLAVVPVKVKVELLGQTHKLLEFMVVKVEGKHWQIWFKSTY